MNVYDDVLDATVVSHSATGHLTTLDYEELITVRTNILSVYRIDDGGRALVMTSEFKFAGKINDIALISPRGPQEAAETEPSPLDCLIISTGVAKLSLLRFDEASNTLKTLSLHYYEDKMRSASLVEMAKTSQMRIDPGNKCLILLNNEVLAILPFCGADDEDEDDEDEDESYIPLENTDGPPVKRQKTDLPNQDNVAHNSGAMTNQSLVVPLKELNSEIQNVSDFQFLRNFTKPTVAVMYQPKLTWAGSLKLEKTPTCIVIMTLGISSNEGKTTVEAVVISKLEKLPWTWNSIIPTEKGAVILGVNEIAYMDNTGVLQSVISINSFSEKDTIQSRVIDNSKMELLFHRGSVVNYWCSTKRDGSSPNSDSNDLLILMTEKSDLYYVQMEFEGKLLTKFDLVELPIANNIFIDNLGPLCISRVNSSTALTQLDLFIGFQSGNSLIVRLNNMKSTIASRTSHTMKVEQGENIFSDGEMDEDDEDDLYADDSLYKDNKESTTEEVVETVEPFDIEPLTSLLNIGPLTSMVVGKDTAIEPRVKGLPNPSNGEFSIVATSGNGVGSRLVAVQPSVHPDIQQALKFISITQIWNLKFKNRDKYLVTTDSAKSKSDIYEIENNFTLHKGGRLRRDATTVYISMFGDGKRIVQVTTNHLYLYDLDFRRLTTIKFDYEVVHVSVLDHYILVTVSKGDITVFELEQTQKKKLSKVVLPEILKEMVITSGLILKSDLCNEFLTLEDDQEEQLLFTFVTADNQIIFFTKDHNDRIFQLNGVDDLKENLFVSTYQLPEEVVPDPSIKQIMLNKLGHQNRETYLTILTFGGEVYQYKKSHKRSSRYYRNMCGSKLSITGAPNNAYPKGVVGIERIMHHIENYNGYSCILISGMVPYIIIKEDDSVARVFKFANIPLVSLTPWGKMSVMCVDHIKNARVYTLDNTKIYYGNKLPIKWIPINNVMQNFMTFNNIFYHERSEMYVVSYTKEIDYIPKSENDEIIIGYNENVPHAKGFQSGVLLINPLTWNVIDQVDLEVNSLVNDLRTMNIQLDTHTKRSREYVVFGVAQVGTEDLPASGSFYVYDIVPMAPDPGSPDMTSKFEKFFSEEVRGAVTTVCELSGRFAISQNHKIMVRDAQEDGSVVPVAFLDTPVYVTDSKSFGNFFIVGDSMQGFEFIGFDAEPYRMIQLGKSISHFETVSVDFLVNNGDLYFVVTDRNNILHVLKYAPDEPNSLSGQRLVHCSSFNLFSANTCIRLLPKSEQFNDNKFPQASYQVIGTQTDGSIFKVVPLSEDSYRRMYVIQQQFVDKDVHLAGLNPNMERLTNKFYDISHIMRPVLDYNVISRFASLSIEKRTSLGKKTGRRSDVTIWRDLIDIEFSLRTLSR